MEVNKFFMTKAVYILDVLKGNRKSYSVTDIFEATGFTRVYIYNIVDKFEDSGLVERVNDEGRDMKITAKGRDALKHLKKIRKLLGGK